MIKSVRMVNWRAYDDRTVRFEPGLTFVVGANGAGKTSILEAIAYGLTGEPATVERVKLLRSPDRLATVAVEFVADGEACLVERRQSAKRADAARLISTGDGSVLAHTQAKVTEEVERLMGVSADFLRRIVYMAEGDVFRFLREPPGQVLEAQVRRVLGLSQLDEFTPAVREAARQVKGLAREVAEQLAALRGLGVESGPTLDQRMSELDRRRSEALAGLRAVQSELTESQRADADRLRLASRLEETRLALGQDTVSWSDLGARSVLEVLADLERQLDGYRSRADDLRQRIARLEGEQATYERIREILAPLAAQAGVAACPVCGKPMQHEECDRAMEGFRARLSEISSEVATLRGDLATIPPSVERLSVPLRTVGELRNYLVHVPMASLGPSSSFAELERFARRPTEVGERMQREVEQRARSLERELAQLEDERAAYVAALGRLRALGYGSPDEARDGLVALETRAIALHAAERAAEETVSSQRNLDLGPVLGQIAAMWGSFVGSDAWRVELDEKGLPLLRSSAGRLLDLSQCSGGEKTALMVMIHTIIAHHFSKSRFILIDEPLEHLDPVNRRSLIRFLVSACRKGVFEQAIVTTFEESLIRKYLSDEGVHTIAV